MFSSEKSTVALKWISVLPHKIKGGTSFKHPLKVYVNLLGDPWILPPCVNVLTERPEQLLASASQNCSVSICLHQTCKLSHSLHAPFSRLSTHLKGSSGHSSNVYSQLQIFVACLRILLDKPQVLEPRITTWWSMHDKCVDYFDLIINEF